MILIVGAGMAGMSVALHLKKAGRDIMVIDKGRGTGGRISARRYGDASFDHGAQYVTARSAAFQDWLDELEKAGRAGRWNPVGKPHGSDWWVGVPRMSQLVKHPELDDITLRTSMKLQRMGGEAGAWTAQAEDLASGNLQDLGPFEAVILTVPAEQLQDLLPVDTNQKFLDVAGPRAAPCWALMVDFAKPVATDKDILRDASPAIGWAAREASKPGRPTGQRWLVQASPGWSRDHLEFGKEDIIARLLAAFSECLGGRLPEHHHVDVHRWRYARVDQALGQPFVADESQTFFAAGDWCLGPRVEAAFESGLAAAEAMLSA